MGSDFRVKLGWSWLVSNGSKDDGFGDLVSSFLIRLQNGWDSGGVGICDVRLHRGKRRPAMEYPCPTLSHSRCLSALPKDLKGFLDWKSKSVSPGIGLDPR